MSLQGEIEPSGEAGADVSRQYLERKYDNVYERIDDLIARYGTTEQSPIPESLTYEVDLLLRLLFILCRVGFPFYSTEVLLSRLAKHLDLELYLSAAPRLINITVLGEKPRKSVATYYALPLPRNLPGPFHLDQIEDYGKLTMDASEGRLSPEETYNELYRLLSMRRYRPEWVYILFGGISGLSLAGLFPDARWLDLGFAFIFGAVTQILLVLGLFDQLWTRPLRLYEFTIPFIVSFLVGIFSIIVPITVENVIIASIAWILPGISLTLAAIEVSTLHTVLGAARFVFSILVVLLLAFGLTAGLLLVQLPAARRPDYGMGPGIPVLFAFIFVPLTSLSFAILLNARYIHWPAFVVTSAAAFTTEILFRRWAEEFSVALAAFIVGSLGILYSYYVRVPSILLITAGILMLVPGSLAVLGFVQTLEGDITDGIEIGLQVLIIAVQIAVAILASNIIFRNSKSI
ncbi:hypothetical protein P9112_009857 [Eukaryota sp. TZLM1-RC]